MAVTRPTIFPSHLWDYPKNDYFHYRIVELKYQSLVVRTKNFTDDLVANVAVFGEETKHLGWRQSHFQVNVVSLDALETSGIDRERAFHDGEETSLPVWYACRVKELFSNIGLDSDVIVTDESGKVLKKDVTESYCVFLNTIQGATPIRTEDRRNFVDLTIRLAPVDRKPRKFRLCISSWDDLDLTELS